MKLNINGEQKELSKDGLNVTELLTEQNVDMPDMVTVELNGDILDKDQYGSTILKEGDSLEFLYFMGGGRFEA